MSTAIPLSSMAARRGPWQQNFMAIVPAITTHAQIRFRGLAVADREEAIAEAVAAACVNYRQLVQHKQLHRGFVSSVADFAVRHVVEGRHVGGAQNSTDALSQTAQRRHGFAVTCLPIQDRGTQGWQTMVLEDRRTSPADLAAFRLDFQDWRRGFSRRHRQAMDLLAAGERPSAVARRLKVTPGRVSQLRTRWRTNWVKYQGLAVA